MHTMLGQEKSKVCLYVWKTYHYASVSLHFGTYFVMPGFACTESIKDCFGIHTKSILLFALAKIISEVCTI